MLAADAGKKIEKRLLRCGQENSHGQWEKVSYPQWNFSDFEYRVKPEPGIIYRVQYSDGGVWESTDKDAAIARWSNSLFNPTLQKIITNE